ncbi:hypothetical protein BDFB_011292, partial [Asbolus verrucosus]
IYEFDKESVHKISSTAKVTVMLPEHKGSMAKDILIDAFPTPALLREQSNVFAIRVSQSLWFGGFYISKYYVRTMSNESGPKHQKIFRAVYSFVSGYYNNTKV